MKRKHFVFSVAVAAVTAGLVGNARAQSYTITDIGALCGSSYSQAFAINNAGQVVGDATFPGFSVSHAFLYSNGSIQDLGGGESKATAINSAGQIVGCTYDSGSSNLQAVLFSGGGAQPLGTLVSPAGSMPFTVAQSINSAGQIVGYGQLGSGVAVVDSFLYSNGTMQDLSPSLGQQTSASGINDSGEIVGVKGNLHPFLYRGGTMLDLGVRIGSDIGPVINNAGQVAGTEYVSGSTICHAYLYSGGVMQDLGTLGGALDNSSTTAINNLGQIVGTSTPTYHAFLYTDGVMLDLNSMITNGSGWHDLQPFGINDSGQIVGEGVDSSGHGEAFLLTPVVPEPSSLGVLAVTGGAALWRPRRRGISAQRRG